MLFIGSLLYGAYRQGATAIFRWGWQCYSLPGVDERSEFDEQKYTDCMVSNVFRAVDGGRVCRQ